MTRTLLYSPLIKWRRGEQNALRAMHSAQRQQMLPILEIQFLPAVREGDAPKTLDDHLVNVARSVEVAWGYARALFDPYYFIADERVLDGRLALTYLLDCARRCGLRLTPVTSSDRSRAYQDAVRMATLVDQQGAAIRIELNKAFTFPVEKTIQMVDAIGISPDQTDLILDLRDVAAFEADALSEGIERLLADVPSASWRSVILLGGSFPFHLSGMKPGSQTLLPRVEAQAWTLLQAAGRTSGITFGDYGIAHPDAIQFDRKHMQVSASIRYTTESNWMVLRGKSLKHGFDQYYSLSRQLVSDSRYAGHSFSSGDRQIWACSREEVGPGTPSTWRRDGMNHHWAHVLNQLAALRDSAGVARDAG